MEVGPSSFLKVKLLGKGDVGRVYLVREKKSNKLFAMKGNITSVLVFSGGVSPAIYSVVQEGDDRTEKDQTRTNRARDLSDIEPPFHCYPLPFVSIGRVPLLLHGLLYGGRILPCTADSTGEMSTRGWFPLLRGRGSRCAGVFAPDGIHIP